MADKPKTAEQINREAGVISAIDVYNEFAERCYVCKSQIERETAKRIRARIEPFIPNSFSLQGNQSVYHITLPCKVWQQLWKEFLGEEG